LPETVRLVDTSEASILVTAIIEKKETKTIEIPKSKIQVLNLSSRYTFNYSNNDNLIITVKGLAENINGITANDIQASIDLEGLNEIGTKTIPVSIALPEGIDAQIVGEVNVSGVVARNNNNTP
jgi:hypothetical protein